MRIGLLTALRLKWWIVGLYWLVLFCVAYVVTAAWTVMSGHVDWAGGDYLGLSGLEDLWNILTDRGFALFMVICLGAFILLQVLLLLPARYPAKAAKGVPVWLAIGSAALIAAGLVVAFFAVVAEVLNRHDLLETMPVQSWWGLALVVALHWAVMTPLVWAFVRRCDNRESVVRRLSMALFIGSVIDVAAMIPLDVMIRRKASCYSWSTSVYSLGVAAAIGLLVLGPMVWMPISARRRRRWFEEHCSACGYDMRAGGDRCPECGTKWRALEATMGGLPRHENQIEDPS